MFSAYIVTNILLQCSYTVWPLRVSLDSHVNHIFVVLFYHLPQILTLLLTCGGLNCQSLELISVKYRSDVSRMLTTGSNFKNSQQREPVPYVPVGETETCPRVFIAVSDYALKAAAYRAFDTCSHISKHRSTKLVPHPKYLNMHKNKNILIDAFHNHSSTSVMKKNIHLHMKHHTYEIRKKIVSPTNHFHLTLDMFFSRGYSIRIDLAFFSNKNI